MVTAEHLRSGPSSSRDVQLHSVVEEVIVLLPVTLVLTQQHGRNTMVLSLIAAREAQGSAGLLCGVILCDTLLNEVVQGIGRHVLKDLIFLDSCSV
jgi:hypothetical protein